MQIKTHNGGWAVFARWLGAELPVFGGAGTSIWECINYRREAA